VQRDSVIVLGEQAKRQDEGVDFVLIEILKPGIDSTNDVEGRIAGLLERHVLQRHVLELRDYVWGLCIEAAQKPDCSNRSTLRLN
jgi:hypothetical protein